MLSQYAPTVKAVIAFINQLNVRVHRASIKNTLQNHPDWPSLLAISDSLRQWKILNAAGNIAPSNIDELSVPFMAYSINAHNPIEIVTAVSKDTIEVISYPYNKPHLKLRDTFLGEWDGSYLIAETNDVSGEADYSVKKRNYFFQRAVLITALSSVVTLLLFQLQQTLQHIPLQSRLFSYTQFILLIAGVGVTSLLIWYEIDKNNPFLKKVCTGIKKGNCNAILSSKASKVFSWLSWSETGFFFFAGSLLVLCLSQHYKMQTIQALGWLSLMAMPYTIYSVYYQGFVAKQWCILCLTVQAIIISCGINTLFNLFPLVIPDIPIVYLFSVLLLFVLPVSTWFSLKPLIKLLQEHSTTKRDYQRIKFNTQIFYSLLSKQKKITADPVGLGIDIGNPDAMYTLIKVCNPYCGPCADAHPELEKVLSEVNQLKLKIIFVAPNNPQNFSFNVVRHMMAVSDEYDQAQTHYALNSWYMGNKKEYEDFAAKFPVKQDLKQPAPEIEKMFDWCMQNKVTYTPTYFLNGHQLPDTYKIADLQYFLLD